MSAPAPSLADFLRPGAVRTEFQPLVAVKNRSVIALEALSRGVLPGRSALVPPQELFALARTPAERLALDRACRLAAVAAFAPLHAARRDLLLTLNQIGRAHV